MKFVSLKTFYILITAVFTAANCQPMVTSPEYLCLENLVQLTCSAQGSARWRSDDILGPDQSISFTESSINSSETVGNGTGVLIETDPLIVTSLSFNLTADEVETNCTDGQTRTTTTKSSVQPSPKDDFSITPQAEDRVSITWDPPSNINDFKLQNYNLTIKCGEITIRNVTKETAYRYEGSINSGPCTATVEVINSCGDTSSNSTTFMHTNELAKCKEENTILASVLSPIIVVSGVCNIVLVIVVIALCWKNKKNKKKEGSQGFTQPIDGDGKTDNQYSL